MIKPTYGRILVAMIDPTNDLPNSHQLILVDKKKHYQHTVRRGRITALGRGVSVVKVGDVVLFRGDAGFTLDGDPEVERAEYGEGFRWLKESDLMAVEEPVTETSTLLQEAVA